MGEGVNQDTLQACGEHSRGDSNKLWLMSQHMDMQMFKQEQMEAQAIGDIYKNGGGLASTNWVLLW